MRLTKTMVAVIGIWVSSAYAEETCFIAMNAKTGEVVTKKGTVCESRIAPMSTFKIALSLMGFESKILHDETHPVWNYTPRPDGKPVDTEKQVPCDPKSWMANSIVWYSQALTPKIGYNQFKNFIEQFDYGNKDVSGNKIKQDGLTNSWLESSLEISPYEQVVFLRKLVNKTLPLSPHTYDMTQRILLLEKLEGNWNFYGKTGTGALVKADGTNDLDKQFAWLVGWFQKDEKAYVYAFNIRDVKEVPNPKARQAIVKEYMKELL